jgi:hypothetical protein
MYMNELLVIPQKRKYTKRKPGIAYTKKLAFGLLLEVKGSANGWWVDRELVERLVDALSYDLSIPQACAYAGITVAQYKYFVRQYPVFNEARRGYQMYPLLQAKLRIVRAIKEGNLRICRWYIQRHDAAQFGSPSRMATKRQTKVLKAQQIRTPSGDQIFEKAVEKLSKDTANFFDTRYKQLIIESRLRKTAKKNQVTHPGT